MESALTQSPKDRYTAEIPTLNFEDLGNKTIELIVSRVLNTARM